MRRFSFRHAGILRLRRHREDVVRGELHAARDGYAREDGARLLARERRMRHAREISGGTRRLVNIDDIVLGENYLAGLNVEIADRRRNMRKIGERIVEIGTRLTEAMRGRKIMEKLQDRARGEHRRVERKREQAEIDEVAARRGRGNPARKGELS